MVIIANCLVSASEPAEDIGKFVAFDAVELLRGYVVLSKDEPKNAGHL